MNSVENIYIDSTVNELCTKTIATQVKENTNDYQIESRIYLNKKENCIFKSFTVKIGDLISVKSKLIEKEKAEIKYTDCISSGNAAIFVCLDPYNRNRIIINLGYIPPKEKVVFISEFLYYTESSESYEIELFRNLPIIILRTNEVKYFNSLQKIKGKVEIKTKNKIKKINKNNLLKGLEIIQEKFIDEKKMLF